MTPVVSQDMTAAVVRAPLGWFEANPLGRVLNRFSSDIAAIDTDIAYQFKDTIVISLNLLVFFSFAFVSSTSSSFSISSSSSSSSRPSSSFSLPHTDDALLFKRCF